METVEETIPNEVEKKNPDNQWKEIDFKWRRSTFSTAII